jgi:putative membrane protein insertion efficiency factor
MKQLLLALLAFYRYAISPMLGRRCRFFPSCSEYAAEAVEKHGASQRKLFAVHRLFRCHPWNPGGFDPVP